LDEEVKKRAKIIFRWDSGGDEGVTKRIGKGTARKGTRKKGTQKQFEKTQKRRRKKGKKKKGQKSLLDHGKARNFRKRLAKRKCKKETEREVRAGRGQPPERRINL